MGGASTIATIVKNIRRESKFKNMIENVDLGVKWAMSNKKIITTIIRIITIQIISISNIFCSLCRHTPNFTTYKPYQNHYYEVYY